MREEKKVVVEYLKNKIINSNFIFFLSYLGLNVEEQQSLKNTLKKQGSSLQIFKNTFIKIACKETNLPNLEDISLSGGTALVLGQGEVSEAAKVIQKISKVKENIKFKYSFVEKNLLGEEDSNDLVNLPTKDEARARLLQIFQAVPEKFVRVLNAVPSGIINVINAKKNLMEK